MFFAALLPQCLAVAASWILIISRRELHFLFGKHCPRFIWSLPGVFPWLLGHLALSYSSSWSLTVRSSKSFRALLALFTFQLGISFYQDRSISQKECSNESSQVLAGPRAEARHQWISAFGNRFRVSSAIPKARCHMWNDHPC